MKLLLITSLIFLLSGCAGMSLAPMQVQVPDIRNVQYKDLIDCKAVESDPNLVDCKIKVGDSGFSTVIRFKISEVPLPPK